MIVVGAVAALDLTGRPHGVDPGGCCRSHLVEHVGRQLREIGDATKPIWAGIVADSGTIPAQRRIPPSTCCRAPEAFVQRGMIAG